MDAKERILAGASSGFVSTFVLSGLRMALAAIGVVDTTAPEQVFRRAEELGLLEGLSPNARRALMLAAHFLYGTVFGMVFGVLRRTDEEPESEIAAKLRGNRDDPQTEAAVSATMEVLSWGEGWAGWLP